MSVQYNKSRHSAYMLHVHMVFITKYRSKVLGDKHRTYFSNIAKEICAESGSKLLECNGEDDHMHMLISYAPTLQLSRLVNNLKAVTSRRMRNEFVDLRAAYKKPVLWSRAYFVGSCGGATLDVVKQYIQQQQG
jgi:putative transposase